MKVLVACFVFAFALWAGSARAELNEVRKRGQLRVLVTEGAPRFFTWKGGASPGIEREILQGFCRLQRVDLAIIPTADNAGVISGLLKGEGDVAAGGLCTWAVAEGLSFSTEILPTRQVVVTRKPGHSVLTVDELKAQKLGIVRGADLEGVLAGSGVPTAQIDDSFEPEALLPALKSGKVSACVVGLERALPAQREDPDFLVGMYLGGRVSIALGLRRQDVQLRGALNEYVTNLRRSPGWNRLVLSYFGDAAADILKATR
jgi:membrane-bound lytic murein transglycosylase MltF